MSLHESENSAGRISTDDDVHRRVRLDDGADGRQVVAADREVVAGNVEDVHLTREVHRADEEDVVASRVKLSLE